MDGARILGRRFTRREFLIGSGLTLGAAAVSLANTQCDPAILRRVEQAKTAGPPRHRVWVWQFSSDGRAEQIAANLGANKLAVVMKTHDGTDWMSKYDRSAGSISGPAAVANAASLFERNGVQFHAWCVVRGFDPMREAYMAAQVLYAGARSLTIDLEGGAGFWAGSVDDARRFGDELRRLSPFGRVDISIDPRPWRIDLVPMEQFVYYTDGIWPQLYWDTFNTPGNHSGYNATGYTVPSDGCTPEFLLEATADLLKKYDRPVIPVGQGAAIDTGTWPRFTYKAWELGMHEVSVWRFGVTPYETLVYLGDNPPGSQPRRPPPTPTPRATNTPQPTATKTPAMPSATRTARPTRTPTMTPTSAPATNTPPPTTNTPVG